MPRTLRAVYQPKSPVLSSSSETAAPETAQSTPPDVPQVHIPAHFPPGARQPGFAYILPAVQYLKTLGKNRTYLTAEDLSTMRVKVTGLDIRSGSPAGGAEAFLELPSLDEINKLARRLGLDSYSGIEDHVLPPIRDSDHCTEGHNSMEAASVSSYFKSCMELYEENVERGNKYLPYRKSLLERFGWSMGGTQFEQQAYYKSYKPYKDWRVDWILTPTNPTTAHVVAFLYDDEELNIRPDLLRFSEMWCILMVALCQHLQGPNSGHKRIPVTMMSSSGRFVRIVQCCPDLAKGHLSVRMSEIISLAEGKIVRWREVVTILTWLLSKPVGMTM